MSLLEQLIRQLGSVEINATGLVLEVDGKPVSAARAIKITVATQAVGAEPVPRGAAAESPEEADEWEWQIAMAQAKARADQLAVVSPQANKALPDAGHLRPIQQLRQMLQPKPILLTKRAKRVRAPRARLGMRRIAHGTAPPVPTDDDVTKPIDIRPLRDSPNIERQPPPLPPPPND